jgi:hypothetical protein
MITALSFNLNMTFNFSLRICGEKVPNFSGQRKTILL